MEKRKKIHRKCVCKFCTGLYFVMQLKGCVTAVTFISKECTRTQLRNHFLNYYCQ